MDCKSVVNKNKMYSIVKKYNTQKQYINDY